MPLKLEAQNMGKPHAMSVVLVGSYSRTECKNSGVSAALNLDISNLWLPNAHESLITIKEPYSKSSRSQPKPDGGHHITVLIKALVNALSPGSVHAGHERRYTTSWTISDTTDRLATEEIRPSASRSPMDVMR
ncbi:hypothetical protein ColLi_03117 [Colletotrichum liriopes]|uniref:Uncharacterized protein n=1 Tax=Colletotrichum liriopes TaxID=708192 RepID=A0AA37GG18_9PEZI|nr:hypothetical protein ColLi_03117 [Colletotrichum liriopes]